MFYTPLPLEWKGYIDDICSRNVDKKEIEEFIVQANRHHPTIKFMAEISDIKKLPGYYCFQRRKI